MEDPVILPAGEGDMDAVRALFPFFATPSFFTETGRESVAVPSQTVSFVYDGLNTAAQR